MLASLLLSSAASGQRVELDDSLSPQNNYAVQLDWEQPVTARAIAAILADGTATAAPPMTGHVPGVEVRLDTAEFEGADARIFMTLPPATAGIASPSDLELQWTARTPFLPGSVRPGESELLFEGRIVGPIMTAVFDFSVLLFGEPETDTFDVEPLYELELLP
jgi:hypothetical protein